MSRVVQTKDIKPKFELINWIPETKWLAMAGSIPITSLVLWGVYLMGYEILIADRFSLVLISALVVSYLVPEKQIAVASKIAARHSKKVVKV